MDLIVSKSKLKGSISIPGSKSHTIRAVAIASLAKGTSNISNPLISSDTLSAVDCYRALGATIDTNDHKNWVITGTAGKVTAPDSTINVGNSGTTLRVALASAALAEPNATITFTGDEQIQSRPLGELLSSLNDLGAAAAAVKANDMAPVTVSGKLKGGKTTLKCITSQYLSSLLLAAPLAEDDPADDVDPEALKIDAPTRLNLDDAGITSIIWTTGFTGDTSWIKLDGHSIERDRAVQSNGSSPAKGLYFIGQPWLRTRGSGVIYGVDDDAAVIAETVANS